MNRRQAESFEDRVSIIEIECTETRRLVERLLELFMCETCSGTGYIYDEDGNGDKCDWCGSKGYTRKCGAK